MKGSSSAYNGNNMGSRTSVKFFWQQSVLLFATFVLSQLGWAQSRYESIETAEVVKNKLFPKNGTFEVNVPDLGMIMNESYITTLLLHFGANYYFAENWGVGADLALPLSITDKSERECIENFYNDPNYVIAAECGPSSELAGFETQANMGPAYVPIRQIKSMLGFYGIWSPLYGKQLLWYSGTSYFDFFLTFGGALIASDYYPKSTLLRNGKTSRGSNIDTVGASAAEETQYGKEGRPDPESGNNFATVLGIGQKYHFAKRFHIKLELRNYTMFGTDSGFDTFFTLWLGSGVRF